MVITKARVGMAASYAGQMLFPLAGPHVVIQMTATEHGVTGRRDAIATAAMAHRGEIILEPPESPGGPSAIKGWFQDPYDPAFDRDALNCVSDDDRLDAVLPKHPLSKIRATLAAIRATATLNDAMPRAAVPDRPSARFQALQPRRGRMSSAALGLLCLQAGRFPQSEQALAESIGELEASGRAPDADLARQLLLLGLALDCQGKHHEAIPVFQRSERAAVAALGPDDLLVGQSVNNQARARIAIHDHAAAEPQFERALALFESKEGQQSNTAIALNGLGMVRNAQQRYDDAIPLLERALKIFEKEYGPECPDCGTVWGHLAIAFAHTGDERRAKDAMALARHISKR